MLQKPFPLTVQLTPDPRNNEGARAHMSAMRRLTTLSLLLSCALSCSAPTPQDTLVLYADALNNDEIDQAYALLSPEVQNAISYDAFSSNWGTYKKQMLPIIDELRSSENSAARVSAALKYSDYDTLSLNLTNDGWKITSGLFRFYAQSSPREALISFVRAMENRRFKVLMKFIPSEYTQHMTPESLKEDFERRPDEIDELVEELKANLHNPIQIRKDHAYMRYGDSEVTFVQEGDVWKIEDPD